MQTQQEPQSTSLSPPALPPSLRSKLLDYRQRVWWTKGFEALSLALLGAALGYLILFGLDRVMDTGVAARVALFVLAIAGAVVFLPWALGKWGLGHRSLDSVADRIKRKDPVMGDRVLGVLELTQNEQEFRRSPELVAAAIEQGARETQQDAMRRALPNSLHKRFGVLATGALAICAAGFAMYPEAAKNSLARLVRPGADIPRYTFAQVQSYDRDQVVARMEPSQIRIDLSGETRRRPQTASLSIQGMGEVEADLKEGGYAFALPGLSENAEVRLSVGDYRGRIRVQPMDRPELVTAQAVVELPAYLEITEPVLRDVRSGSLGVVEQSRASFQAQATRDLARASWALGPIEVTGDTLETDGVLVTETKKAEIAIVDGVGLEGVLPFPITMRARPDGRPTVSMKDLGQEAILLHGKVLTLAIQAEDDFGVREVGIEWESVGEVRGPFEAAKGSKVLQTGAPSDRRLELSAAFHPKSLGIDPQALELKAYALDALPGRPRVYSAPVLVQIMTEEEHMIWVTAELSKWFDKAVEVRDTEHQLLTANEEMYQMSNEALASPQGRRDLQAQADKERANARRLDRLLESGSELLQEALRNEQFNSNTLDDWAEMMATLEEIGENRMPSVAELLDKAARANPSKGSTAQAGKPSQGKPSESQTSGDKPSESSPSEGEPSEMAANGESQPGEPSEQTPMGETQPGAASQPSAKAQLPNAPSVQDPESHFNDPIESKPSEGEPAPAPPSHLTLASTSVSGGGAKPQDQEPAEPQASEEPQGPTKEELAKALAEQRALMEEFEKVTGKIQEVLRDLEGSTFVKRLKSLSRTESQAAKNLDVAVSAAFGSNDIPKEAQKIFELATSNQEEAAEKASVVRSDLGAYVDRLKSKDQKLGHFERVYTEMGDRAVAREMATLGALAKGGMVGEAIAGSENIADDLDRWAELLIGPG